MRAIGASIGACVANVAIVEAECHTRSIMQGHTGNMCTGARPSRRFAIGACEKRDICVATSGCS
jgi:hypothetical protein